jgi:hypothetical protein
LIETGELNFRQIQSISRINLNEILSEELSRNNNELSIIRLLFSVLISISGSAENLKTSFKKLADKEPVCDFSKKLDNSSSAPLDSQPNSAIYQILFFLILIDFTLEKWYLTKEDTETFYFCSHDANFNRKIQPSGHVDARFTKKTQILRLAEKEDIKINYCSVTHTRWNNNPMFKYINYFALMAKVLEDLQAQKLL